LPESDKPADVARVLDAPPAATQADKGHAGGAASSSPGLPSVSLASRGGDSGPANAVEALFLSPDGGVLILGWAYDVFDTIAWMRITGADWRLDLEGSSLARVRRADLPGGLGVSAELGYFGLGFGDRAIGCSGSATVEIGLRSGQVLAAGATPSVVSGEQIRDIALAYIARAHRAGEAQIKAAGYLGRGMGDQLLALNHSIVRRCIAGPYLERFGPEVGDLVGSIVVCLYGRPEFLFLQAALFSNRPGIGEYEFIYVLNSPELAEAVLNEARSAAMIYGLAISVVVLAGNAGFAAANNVAARVARSDRLVFVNPDVFPKDPNWALRHSAVLLSRPARETTLFGATLYYDNGSLMHGGMYLDLDVGATFSREQASRWGLLRVEHYGKGAPPDDAEATRPRPVTAVTGAFISAERDWFEELSGFSIDYMLGHYEDADLCLRSLAGGVAPWLHDLKLWHLEGGGGTRHEPHEGAAHVNRWLFTTRWRGVGAEGLLGRNPSHPLLGAS